MTRHLDDIRRGHHVLNEAMDNREGLEGKNDKNEQWCAKKCGVDTVQSRHYKNVLKNKQMRRKDG